MNTMKTVIAALALAISAIATPVFAQSVDEEALAAACEGKQAGDVVMIDGNEATCK